MLSTPLTRIAKCAAIIAVFCTVLFPPPSLVCRNCLVHGLLSFDSEVDFATHDQLHTIDGAEHSHSCDANKRCGSQDNSQENCPCELVPVDLAMAFSPSVIHKINVEFLAYSFCVDLHWAISARCTLDLDSYSKSSPSSLPLVLRI